MPKAKSGYNVRFPSVQCPHCKSVMKASNSNQITPMYKEITYRCKNDLCGFAAVYSMTPDRTLSPSASPDGDVDIPLSTHVDVQGLLDFLEKGKVA